MSTSLVYQSPFLYELMIRCLYGRYYNERYETIAELIPDGATVLDVCCGPATVYHRCLKHKNIKYTGVDINPGFIENLRQAGVEGVLCDLDSDAPLPQADIVLMQASLYHFLPEAGHIIDRLLAACRHQVIIAEPVRNIADSDIPLIRWLTARMTNPGTGRQASRFNIQLLDATMAPYQAAGKIVETRVITGGREKIVVLRP